MPAINASNSIHGDVSFLKEMGVDNELKIGVAFSTRLIMMLFDNYVKIKYQTFSYLDAAAVFGSGRHPLLGSRGAEGRLLVAARIIAAIGTPLTADEHLHVEGLSLQLERLWAAGIDGIFAAGTLGVMPMLTDDTYRELIEQAVHLARGRGELFVGASDQSFARVQQRIAYINQFKVDGVVALPPYFMRFSQQELIGFYRALADESHAPVYLYDLPQRTHLSLDNKTILTLAEHPNIVGIKCSGPIEQARQLIDQLARREIRFRVVVAQPDQLNSLVAAGVIEHLDGIYTLAPRWTVQIAQRTSLSNREQIKQLQADLTELRDVMRRHGSLSAFTVLMNACGVPGCFAPLPYRKLNPSEIKVLFQQPVVQKFLATEASVSANV